MAAGSGGCAALAELGSSPTQMLELSAGDGQGAGRTGLRCTLRNDRGQWSVEVPGRVEVLRSAAPLRIECIDSAGAPALQADVAATDERRERAGTAATRYGVVGAVFTPLFLGTLALGPAAIVYMGVTAAVAAGAGAADQAVTDTVSGRGFSYPARIDLR